MVSQMNLKNLIKNIFFWGLDFLLINNLFRIINRGKIKVLMYHSITERDKYFENGVSLEDFRLQIIHLRKHYNVIPANLLDDPSVYKSNLINVVITFDDGFKDNRTVASGILKREGFSAIFFVIADCLKRGDVPAFLRKRNTVTASFSASQTIDLDDAREMLDFGMVIGAHSMRHDDYTLLGYCEGIADATEAQNKLQNHLDVPVSNFAFPWGRFRSGQETDLLRLYRRVFLTDHGFNLPGDRVLFRNEVFSTMQLRAATSGSLDFFRDLFRTNK